MVAEEPVVVPVALLEDAVLWRGSTLGCGRLLLLRARLADFDALFAVRGSALSLLLLQRRCWMKKKVRMMITRTMRRTTRMRERRRGMMRMRRKRPLGEFFAVSSPNFVRLRERSRLNVGVLAFEASSLIAIERLCRRDPITAL